MNRAQKEEQLAFLKETFSGCEGLVLTSVKGLTVGEVTELRCKLHEAGVNYRVVKNTLARKAIEGTEMSALDVDFREETAIAWSTEDAVTPAKVVMKFKEDVKKFTVKAGFASGGRLDAAGVEALSKLPNLDELRSMLLGLFQQVPTNLVKQVNAPGQQVAMVLQAHKDKQEAA